MDFSASLAVRGHRAHLAFTGELDAVTTVQVRWRFDDALEQGCLGFTVDTAGLTFVDAAGLAPLVHLRNMAFQRGGTVTFVATSPIFRRVCALAGLTEAFRLTAPSEPAAYELA